MHVHVHIYFPSPWGAQAEYVDVFSESPGAWPMCVHFQSLWEPSATVVRTMPSWAAGRSWSVRHSLPPH